MENCPLFSSAPKHGVWMCFEGFLRFRKIFEQGYSAEDLRDFVELMNREQHLFHILNLSAGNLDHMCLATHDALTENGRGDIIAAAKMSGTTRRGDIIFLTNSRRVRTQIDQIIKQLRSEFGDFIHLDYASWLDDEWGEGGLKVEQYLQEKIYSSFVPANALRLEEYTAAGQNNQIISPVRFQKDQFDLLLDTIHEKIYLHGKPTTSKKLPSQKAAIEILSTLLSRLGQIVSNKDLPVASYSSYRNEFQGKITSPLLKLLGDKIKIDTEGELLNFTVRLELARGTKVGVLKQIL